MSDNRFVRDIYQDTLQQTTIENLKFYENISRRGNSIIETIEILSSDELIIAPWQRNLTSSGSGVGGNNEIVTPTLDSGSLYQRYISPYRFWMSRDVTPPAGQPFSNVNISYQCLEPEDIKAELARDATGVQRYLLTPDNFLQRYLLDNWFGQPFVPGYGWDDPILRWISPTGSGGKPVEHIITNPIYKPPSFPPVTTDPNPPSPRPPSPWWEDTDTFPTDEYGPGYKPERELEAVDVDGTDICGRYFIDPTTGAYWFKRCDNKYFTWHPEGFWLPWGSDNIPFSMPEIEEGLSIENPECVYRDRDEFTRQYLRENNISEWFYEFVRNIRFARETGWLPPDFPLPGVRFPASGEGAIITFPEYEYLIKPKVL